MVFRVFFLLKRQFSDYPLPTIKRLKLLHSEEQIKNHFKSVTSSSDFIETLRCSIYLYKSDHKFPFKFVLPLAQTKLKNIFSNLNNLELSEAAALVYIMKSARDIKINSLYTKTNEIDLINKIDELIDKNIEFSKLTPIFRDIVLAEKSSKKLESILLDELLNKNNEITIDDIRRILIATTNNPKDRFREIETQALNRLENANLDLGMLKQLSDCLKFAGMISMRRDCERNIDLIKLNINIRIKYFDISDFRNVIDFYELTKHKDYSLFYDVLYEFEKFIDNRGKFTENDVYLICVGLKKLIKFKPDLQIRPELFEKMISYIIFLHKNSKFGLIRTFECFTEIIELTESPSNQIKEFIDGFKNNETTGYWRFIYLKLLSHYESFENHDFNKLIENHQFLLDSTITLKIKLLHRINEIKNIKKIPKLASFSDSVFERLIQESNNEYNIVNISLNIEDIRDYIDIELYKKLMKNIFRIFSIPNPANKVYFYYKYTIPYLNQDDTIYNEWRQFIMSNPVDNYETLVSSLLLDYKPKKNLRPYLYLTSKCNSKKLALAKICSIKSNTFTSNDLNETFEMIKQEGPSFLSISAFNYSKESLLNQILEKFPREDSNSFINKANDMLSSSKFTPETYKHAAALLANLGLLSQQSVQNMIKTFKISSNIKNFEDLVLDYSKLFDLFQKDGLNDYLIVDRSINFNNLIKRLDAYMNWDNQISNNEEILDIIKEKLNLPENSRLLPNLIKVLAEKKYHNAFREEIILYAVNLINEYPQKYQSYKILDSFCTLIGSNIKNDELIGKLEPIVFSHDLSNHIGIKLIKAYAKINRINDYFNTLCNNIEPELALSYRDELRLLAPLESDAFNSLLQT